MKNLKKYKKEIILVIVISIFSLIVNNAFLKRHYYSDTLICILAGYSDYALNFFLPDGRIISALQCLIGEMLNIEIDVYIFISNFIAIILMSLSVVLLHIFIIKYLNIENKFKKLLTLLATYTIIFNHMSIEFFIFAESCVMCLGVLFSILATIVYLKGDKNSYLKSFLLLILSTFCYQGVINLFPILVLTLKVLKTKDNKISSILKVYLKNILITGFMLLFALIFNTIVIMIISEFLDKGNRVNSLALGEIIQRFKDLLQIAKVVLKNQLDVLPKNLSIIMMAITIIFMAFYSKNKNDILKYILIVFSAYVFCILPIIVYAYMSRRLFMSIGALMGISLLFVAMQDEDEKISIKNIFIILFVVIYFLFNIINNYDNFRQYLQTFRNDDKMGNEINLLLQEYEQESGNRVTKFAYRYSDSGHVYYDNVKKIVLITERTFYRRWAIEPAMKFYCNRDLEIVNFPDEVYNRYFENKEYTEFSDEQIVFIGDTLYMYVY